MPLFVRPLCVLTNPSERTSSPMAFPAGYTPFYNDLSLDSDITIGKREALSARTDAYEISLTPLWGRREPRDCETSPTRT